jgi:hypothetical protein
MYLFHNKGSNMKPYIAHEEIYRGFKIQIIPDDDPLNPRKEYDNVGKMVCWHRRYDLGDEQPKRSPEEYLMELAQAAVSPSYPEALLERNLDGILKRHYVILELYLYDHSGITMSCSPFSCPWDSGQVGFIYCDLKTALKEWGTPGQEAKGWKGEASYTLAPDGSKRTLREAATLYLQGEVETYDQYLTGQVYGYVVTDREGNDIDSCWGFFDSEVFRGDERSYTIATAREAIDAHINHEIEKHQKQVKTWIRNKVPMQHRQPLDLLTLLQI